MTEHAWKYETITTTYSSRPSVPTGNFQVGGGRCNFRCPYCINQMTDAVGEINPKKLWYSNFDLALSVFKNYNCNTVLITSKGEPLLVRNLNDTLKAIDASRSAGFITELQTNGSLLTLKTTSHMGIILDSLVNAGLQTVAISRVGFYYNAICGPGSEFDIAHTIKECVKRGLTVRLTFIAMKGYNNDHGKIIYNCKQAKKHGVSQITIRRMGRPDFANMSDKKKADEVRHFISDNRLSLGQWNDMIAPLSNDYELMRTFDWGSASWYIEGVECLFTNCLSIPKNTKAIRYLIYSPDGHMRYSWEHDVRLF